MTEIPYLRHQAFIDGRWRDASTGEVFPVFNPATGEEIARVADCAPEDATTAIEAAARAFPAWASRTAAERSAVLRRWYDLMLANEQALAEILTAEMGKPLAEARGEIRYGAAYLEWYAEEAKRVYGDVIPGASPATRTVVIKQPVGVCAAITPWNFPNAMLMRKAAAALAAGCTMVAKPAEDTPLSALAIAALAEEAGVPEGVFNVMTTSNAASVGLELTTNPLVRKLSFTGSTEVGRLLLAQSASTVKKYRWSLAAMRHSSYLTMPILTPRSRAPWRRNIETPGKRASAQTAYTFIAQCMTTFAASWYRRLRRCASVRVRKKIRQSVPLSTKALLKKWSAYSHRRWKTAPAFFAAARVMRPVPCSSIRQWLPA